ncbi:hypothetical protein BVC71_02875 [Marivivens niveibacter]|uniref:Sulfotransferase domain-containing protein n=1 Tax=Marivivens niveibacter TaxID=1930667 RepID=A0A251X245_9RHOB|nr:sulfotransferase [Marivivens niveibacter]OUD10458.1 hypothetical protein BVC71_02875 [Marivivens niveibacter]
MKNNEIRMPDFIIIGAMKSGTTTLHEDLNLHPDIVMSGWKEPGYFVGPDFGGPSKFPLKAARRGEYEKIFKNVPNNKICGESSTHYTKLPSLPNAAENIYKTLGPNIKLIYVVRDPVKRAISQYGHEFQHCEIDIPTLSEAVDNHSSMIELSQYSKQLKPYFDIFPKENILIIKFENLVKKRQAYIDEILKFLGADSAKMPEIDTQKVRNTAGDRRNWTPWARYLRSSPFFQNHVEPLIPNSAHSILKRGVTKQPRKIVNGGNLDTIEKRILNKLSQDDLDIYNSAL